MPTARVHPDPVGPGLLGLFTGSTALPLEGQQVLELASRQQGERFSIFVFASEMQFVARTHPLHQGADLFLCELWHLGVRYRMSFRLSADGFR